MVTTAARPVPPSVRRPQSGRGLRGRLRQFAPRRRRSGHWSRRRDLFLPLLGPPVVVPVRLCPAGGTRFIDREIADITGTQKP